MKHGIIVPCYNESQRLKFDQFAGFLAQHPDYVICFVNDGSSDDTLAKLEAFSGKHNDQVVVYDMPQNGGKAEAVRAGMNHMLESTGVETLGFLDADLSTDFDDYKMLVHHLHSDANSHMVFGSRSSEGADEIKRNGFRNIASKIVGLMIRMLLRLPISDTQCGAKAFKPEAARFAFAGGFVTRWLFDVEIFIRMKKYYGRKQVMKMMREIPLKKWIHVDGSKLGLSDSLKVPGQLLSIAMQYNIVPGYRGAVQYVQFGMIAIATALRIS